MNQLARTIIMVLYFAVSVHSSTFINYDDFQMTKNIMLGGDFQNPHVLKSSILNQIYGWKTRNTNFQLGVGTLYNSNWPTITQICQLVTDGSRTIYQQLDLNESIYLFRFDYAAKQFNSTNPGQSQFYVNLNFVQNIHMVPSDKMVRKVQTIVKTRNGINVFQFMGIQNKKGVGVGIDNVQLFRLKNQTNYPNQVEAVAVGESVKDSDHESQNYELDTFPQNQIQGWCSKSCDSGSWIQISSSMVRQWKSVIIQGRGDQDSWVTSYKVSYTLNGLLWQYAENGKEFQGSSDRNTKIITRFASSIKARALRVIVMGFYIRPCSRIGATYISNQLNQVNSLKVNPNATSDLYPMKGGKDFIQIGNWRLGMVNLQHFSFSHKSGYTSVIYRSDGTIHHGPRTDFSLWGLQNAPLNVKFGNNYIQFGGVWRLTQIDNTHFSISHSSMRTCMIWRVDGTKHPGPRSDFLGFAKNDRFSKISSGQNFIQIGNWRLGEIDNFHMSIGTKTLVSQIYRSDGTIHNGPRMDFRVEKNITLSYN